MALRGCCGCDLRTSSLTIGIVFLVNTILDLIIVIGIWSNFSSNTQFLYNQQGISEVDAQELAAAAQALAALRRAVFVPQLVFAILSLIFNSLLIHGARRSSVGAVLAWLIYYGIVFVIFTLTSIGLLIACGVTFTGYSNLREALGDDVTSDYFAASDSSEVRGARATLLATYIVGVVLGVVGGCMLLISPLLWYWFALVQAFFRELSGYEVGDAVRGRGRQGGEEGGVKMGSLSGN